MPNLSWQLKKHPCRLPDWRFFLIRPEWSCRSGRIRKRTAFPRPVSDHGPEGTLPSSATKASARPGGGEAPAVGGACAGRGLWLPAGPGTSAATWPGRWPRPERTGCVQTLLLYRQKTHRTVANSAPWQSPNSPTDHLGQTCRSHQQEYVRNLHSPELVTARSPRTGPHPPCHDR